MRVLNPFTLVAFVLGRGLMRLGFLIYRVVYVLVRVLLIPFRVALYVVGFVVGLGLVAGLVVLAVNGGHLHGERPNPRPACRGVAVPAAVCEFGGTVERVYGP